ncbi:MAG TPA: hypothetical protein VIW73_14300 [Candidatus Cybelea sp.]
MKYRIVFQIIAVALVVALGVVRFLGDAYGNGDGNPVGFDLLGSTKGVAYFQGTGSCLAQKSCKRIEIHYLQYPVPPCPTAHPGVACSATHPPTRVLPSCPTNAQCIYFKGGSTNATAISQGADKVLHRLPKINAQGIIIAY